MRIFVLGAGATGSLLAQLLERQGHDVWCGDRDLARASLPEIESVMGHEMGHSVLHHVEKGLLEFGVIIVAGFALAQLLFDRLRTRWQERWKVRGPADPAGLRRTWRERAARIGADAGVPLAEAFTVVQAP